MYSVLGAPWRETERNSGFSSSTKRSFHLSPPPQRCRGQRGDEIMLGKQRVFRSRRWRLAQAALPRPGPQPSAAVGKREFWVGQRRNHSDRFGAPSKESLEGAAEGTGVREAPGEDAGGQDRPQPAPPLPPNAPFPHHAPICLTRTFHQLKKMKNLEQLFG